MQHPGDLSELAALLDSGTLQAGEIAGVIGKTEGNGGSNDFTRGYFTETLMRLLGRWLNEDPRSLARRIPCILSGGTEGVLSPHYTILCRRSDMAAPLPGAKALAIGVAFSPDIPFHEIGTAAHAHAVARAVTDAMRDARIDSVDDLHFAQVKTPCLTSDRIAAAIRAGKPPAAKDAGRSMALARAAGAFGVASALGEITPDQISDRAFLADLGLCSARASISSGVEVSCNEVIVLGMSADWTGPLCVDHQIMRDALDAPAVSALFARLGLGESVQVPAGMKDGLRAVFVKCEPDPTGTIRGSRHTMLNDTDIDAQRHIRGAVGGLVAGLAGDTRIFVSGGAEHQGPPGGGLIAAIGERAFEGERG